MKISKKDSREILLMTQASKLAKHRIVEGWIDLVVLMLRGDPVDEKYKGLEKKEADFLVRQLVLRTAQVVLARARGIDPDEVITDGYQVQRIREGKPPETIADLSSIFGEGTLVKMHDPEDDDEGGFGPN